MDRALTTIGVSPRWGSRGASLLVLSVGCYGGGGGGNGGSGGSAGSVSSGGSGARSSGGSSSGGVSNGGASSGGRSSGGATTAGTSSGGESSAGSSSGGSPALVTCERLGGQCACVFSCPAGSVSNDAGSCDQPPPNSGACSLGCCVPDGSGGSGGGSSATLILQCHPDTAIEDCPASPPASGTSCGDANLCCNYTDGQGCVCTGTSYVCQASACGCSG